MQEARMCRQIENERESKRVGEWEVLQFRFSRKETNITRSTIDLTPPSLWPISRRNDSTKDANKYLNESLLPFERL